MGGTVASLIYLGILVVAVGAYLFRNIRLGLGQTLQMALVWGMIFLGAMAVFGLWGDITRDFGRQTALVTDNTITVPRAADGHYYLTVHINDVPVDFLVDTGASDLVLTQRDARRVGLDVDGLVFAGQARTANGTVPIARTRLATVRIGHFEDPPRARLGQWR